MADRIVIIDRGHVVRDAATAELTDAESGVVVRTPEAHRLGEIADAAGWRVSGDDEGRLVIHGASSADVGEAAACVDRAHRARGRIVHQAAGGPIPRAHRDRGGVVTNLLLAEALKLRTTRTMWALLGATVAVSALVATAVVVGSDTNLDLESARGAREIDERHREWRDLRACPRRDPLGGRVPHGYGDRHLPHHAAPVAGGCGQARDRRRAVGLVFGALAAGVSIGIAGLSYRLEGLTFPLGSSDAWSTVGGSVLYAALFGAIGAATGSLVRNQVVAIVGWLAWIAVVEHIATGFAADVVEVVAGGGRKSASGGDRTETSCPLEPAPSSS